MSASRGNQGQAGGLRGDGVGLHTHGPSGASSSSPDELGWPRRRWTQLGGTGEVRRGNLSAWGVLNSDPRWVRSGLIYWVQLVRSDSIGWVLCSGHLR
jgi:hypothetical protein